MQFKTTLKKPKHLFDFSYEQQILMIGSCFAENIGALMQQNYFNVALNPYGIIYNPISLANSIDEIIDNKTYDANDLVYSNELFVSFNHHGKFKNTNIDNVLNSINNTVKKYNTYIKNIDLLFITFGTAFVYEHIENQKIVANCHKFPSNLFIKKMLKTNTIVKVYISLIEKIKQINSNIKVVFTVSPVRHIKDGLIENNRSKAVLLMAVHELVEQLDACYYFPAYELLVDDLRDYRFYANDLVHPNELAIKYIWNYLVDNYLSDKTEYYMIEKYNNLKNHKILFSDTNAAKKHLNELAEMKLSLKEKFSYLNIED